MLRLLLLLFLSSHVHAWTVSRPVTHAPARRAIKAMVELAPSRSTGGASATKDDGNKDDDLVRSPLLDKLEQIEGMWYSDDFYGPHGREWVEVSATLVGAGTSSLVAVKVSGDANVPSGYKTWRTRGLPDVSGPAVPAEIQVRADPNDPNGFSWVPGALVLVAEDQIALTARFGPLLSSSGTFHKHKVGEGDGDSVGE